MIDKRGRRPISNSSKSISIDPERPFLIDLGNPDDGIEPERQPINGVLVTRGLRTSGLLAALPALDLKNLLYLLSFVTPYGLTRPTAVQLSYAMHTSPAKARSRMDRLTRFDWQGRPLVRVVRRQDGEDVYGLASSIIQIREHPLPRNPHSQLHREEMAHDKKRAGDEGINLPAGTEHRSHDQTWIPRSDEPSHVADLLRDRVIAHSRAKYTRPRAEVEGAISRSMGWDKEKMAHSEGSPNAAQQRSGEEMSPPVDDTHHPTRKALLAAGVTGRLADELLDRYPIEEIRRQLDWLPHRKAKSPARFIVAAIEGGYAAPVGLRFNKSDKHYKR